MTQSGHMQVGWCFGMCWGRVGVQSLALTITLLNGSLGRAGPGKEQKDQFWGIVRVAGKSLGGSG